MREPTCHLKSYAVTKLSKNSSANEEVLCVSVRPGYTGTFVGHVQCPPICQDGSKPFKMSNLSACSAHLSIAPGVTPFCTDTATRNHSALPKGACKKLSNKKIMICIQPLWTYMP